MRDNDGENGPAGTGGSAQEEGGELAGAPPSLSAHDSERHSSDSSNAASTRAEPVIESKAVVDAADNAKTVPKLGGNAGGNDTSVCEGRDGDDPTLGDASIGKVGVGDEDKYATGFRDDAGAKFEVVCEGADRGGGNGDDPAVGGALEDPRARQLSGDKSDSDKGSKSVIECPSRTDVAIKGGAIGSVDDNEPADNAAGGMDAGGMRGASPRAEWGLCCQGSHGDQVRGNAGRQVKVGTKRKCSPSKAGASSQSTKKLRLYSPHEVDRSPSSACEVEEKRETCIENSKRKESSDEELLPHLPFAEPKQPRVRSSNTKKEREEMIASHTNVENYVGPVPRRGYATWKSWEVAYADYCRSQRVYYRVRTSIDVDEYNRYDASFVAINDLLTFTLLSKNHTTNITTAQFHKFFLSYRSKHGVFQKRCGVGKRNATVNLTGCPARFDLGLINVASAGELPRHRLVAHSEWRMHNNASEEAAATAGMKDPPTRGAIVDTVAAMHDSYTSPSKCFGYMSEKLGSLVATTPTGRGFPVLDFMALNPNAVTLQKMFELFKSKNSSWPFSF
ncbi:uncharacterized protein PITG_13214 [Phytophthora infestans T30-4]|uniref:Uncharacterized protein n=1 Tax=Phytophthora infestans (strain T30-4) TaxID=403677 RepID=D0NLG2_PHYIT|nr:uncharacterized protein PITG_13214 [Phytophthora infestans T30-4]EEY60509.1 conserved hypothetical protein [Phytophthora infestans T30-4]|eukprot:XP_002899882.1 conserved hypothetical protein [Phytophthora infestans T30-4]